MKLCLFHVRMWCAMETKYENKRHCLLLLCRRQHYDFDLKQNDVMLCALKFLLLHAHTISFSGGDSVLYRIWQELFSRNGFTFWLEKPTRRQSSCSCSVTYFTMSAQACDTGKRCMLASRRNWSTMLRCCCKLLAMRSITAVSESPAFVQTEKKIAKRLKTRSNCRNWQLSWII